MDSLNSDGPPPPRKRVSKACDRCRRRKDKCDGKKPVCSTCAQSSAPCSWNPLSKKRGLPDGYVRGLEKICGAMIKEVPGVEDLILKRFEGGEDDLWEYWADGDGNGGTAPLEVWKKSRLVGALERVLPVLDEVGKRGKKRTWDESKGVAVSQDQIIAPSPKLDPNDTATISLKKGEESTSVASLEPRIIEGQASDSGPVINPISSSNDWILPPNAGRLVEAYFSYTHTWFPIIERHDLLRVLYQGPSPNKKSKITRSSGENAALWAVLAYAEAQYDILSPSNDEHNDRKSLASTADLWYDRAKSLVQLVDGEYELGHVQAVLVLALLKVGREDWKSAWVLVGHAVRVAVNLGLDLIPPNAEQSKLPTGERRRKHVFLGCFVLDTIIAARLGRQPHLRSPDAERVGILDEEGLEEWDHWNDCLGIRRSGSPSLYQATTLSTYNSLIHLIRILNDVICFDIAQPLHPDENFLGHNNGGNLPTNETNGFYNNINTRLASWKASHDSPEENLKLTNHCNLYLTYLSIIMALNLRHPSNSNTFLIYHGQNTIQWLKLYSENFGLLVLPPIYEYSLKLAGDCITHSINATNTPSNYNDINWLETWQSITLSLDQAWPIFQLSTSLPQSNDPTSTSPQNQSLSQTRNQQYIVSSINPITNANMPPPPLSQSQASKSNNPEFWQASRQQQFFTPRVFIETAPHSFHSPAIAQAQIQGQTRVQAQEQVQEQPQFRSTRMETSLLDQDDIFSEFDAMDANLWSNTWEQSLLNLGFTAGDGQNIDEEFYSFFGGNANDGLRKGSGSFGVFEQPQQSLKANASTNMPTAGDLAPVGGKRL